MNSIQKLYLNITKKNIIHILIYSNILLISARHDKRISEQMQFFSADSPTYCIANVVFQGLHAIVSFAFYIRLQSHHAILINLIHVFVACILTMIKAVKCIPRTAIVLGSIKYSIIPIIKPISWNNRNCLNQYQPYYMASFGFYTIIYFGNGFHLPRK